MIRNTVGSTRLHSSTLAIVFIISISTVARAGSITASASNNVASTITGFSDASGNPLSSKPSDLSVVGQATVLSQSATNNGVASASNSGSANVIVGGVPVGLGPAALNIGDGFLLTASADAGAFAFPGSAESSFRAGWTLTIDNSSLTAGFSVGLQVSSAYSITATEAMLNGGSGSGIGIVLTRSPNDSLLNITDTVISNGSKSNSDVNLLSVFIGAGESAVLNLRMGAASQALSSIPEPSSLTLLAAGLFGLGLASMKLRKSSL
jgi:hypothetical protein